MCVCVCVCVFEVSDLTAFEVSALTALKLMSHYNKSKAIISQTELSKFLTVELMDLK